MDECVDECVDAPRGSGLLGAVAASMGASLFSRAPHRGGSRSSLLSMAAQPRDGEGRLGRALEDRGQPQLLARGPWDLSQVSATWLDEHFEPSDAASEAADAAIANLRERGSPSHDGLAARLVDYAQSSEGLEFQLQPLRWALRLVEGDASHSVAALCLTRSADGRWLAGRRAAWLSSWAGRWALGAGGAVDLGENPADTLVRELEEEWAVAPERIRGEALIALPHGMVMFVGQAWLPEDAEVRRDSEHDAHAWWPREVERWPEEATEPLRRMALWLGE